MTNINHSHVSDFKGLKSVDLEYGGLNVITGKNNTGKSSLLESIDVAFDPQSIQRYGGNVHDLINVSADEANLEFKIEDGCRTVALRKPSEQKAVEILVDIVEEVLSRSRNRFPFYQGHVRKLMESDELREAITEATKDEIRSLSDEWRSRVKQNALLVNYDGRMYPYLYRGRWFESLFRRSSPRIANAIVDEFPDQSNALSDRFDADPADLLGEYVHFQFRTHGNDAYFVDESSYGNKVTYIQEPKIESDPTTDDDEDAAVKKVRVRNFLRDHGLMEGLEDFDFDDLVFERDGEQYSVPYSFMGDGLKTIVGILWQFVGDDEGSDIVLLEEPENHLHPGYVKQLVPFLIQVARDEDIQLFITTHNVDFILEFFNEELAPEDREYLESEFRLTQMTDLVPKQFDYLEAEKQIEEVHNDLRGI